MQRRWILYVSGMIIIFTMIGMGIRATYNSNYHNTDQIDTLPSATEYPVIEIPLQGPAARSDAEFSGLSWYKDYLILLPQYPERFSKNQNGVLFAIRKDAILDFLNNSVDEPIEPIEIPFISAGIEDMIDGYQGFEAIVFDGDTLYMSIEAGRGLDMMGYLVTGKVSPKLDKVQMEPESLTKNTPKIKMLNKSDEALLVSDGQVISIFEVNDTKFNPTHNATQFGGHLGYAKEIRFPEIHYRVTDASQPTGDGLFWIINYQYHGDVELDTDSDPLTVRYGEGRTHSINKSVERLIELKYTPDAIELSDKPPIQLEMLGDQLARNWEGLVRLDDIGFLIITDKFPRTILGFVSYPEP